jgi:hypothetical protein
MISQSSVLTTSNYFVTVDKINTTQMVKDPRGETLLMKVSDALSAGFTIYTKYFEISVSPYQKFLTSDLKYTPAYELKEGMEVLTYFGWQKIDVIEIFPAQIEMSNIVTKSRLFLSNGFYLHSD